MSGLRRGLTAPRLFRAGLLSLAAALLWASASAAARPAGVDETTSGPLSVRIVSPVASDLAIGKTDVRVEIASPPGVAILKVELYADDRLVATLLDPPWRHVWDAGDTVGARTLRARVFASDGTTASHKVTTRALQGAQRARVTLVEVFCTVRDSAGRYLTDLGKDDFTVLESGKPQEIALFSTQRKPANLVLLFDASASMARDGKLELAQEAAAGFIKALEPDDRAALVSFSDVPRVLANFDSPKEALESTVFSIRPEGGTALYDAIGSAVDLLKGSEGRKAIILISDGRDESIDGLGPGSIAEFEETLDAVLRSETAVYAIGTGESLREEPDYHRRRTVGEIFESLAGRSGGRSFFVKRASRLKDAYARVADELRHQYTLAYYPPAEAARKGKDPDWRPIEVRVSRPRARVTARSGYYTR